MAKNLFYRYSVDFNFFFLKCDWFLTHHMVVTALRVTASNDRLLEIAFYFCFCISMMLL